MNIWGFSGSTASSLIPGLFLISVAPPGASYHLFPFPPLSGGLQHAVATATRLSLGCVRPFPWLHPWTISFSIQPQRHLSSRDGKSRLTGPELSPAACPHGRRFLFWVARHAPFQSINFSYPAFPPNSLISLRFAGYMPEYPPQRPLPRMIFLIGGDCPEELINGSQKANQ